MLSPIAIMTSFATRGEADRNAILKQTMVIRIKTGGPNFFIILSPENFMKLNATD
jgi:hypothetical protein